MMAANCFLCEFLPRFTLPMWELTIIAAFVLAARNLEHLSWLLAKRPTKHFGDRDKSDFSR
jgi:hypothetical protein